MLDIMQFQGKPTIQTQKNGEKTHLGIDLGPLDPNSSRQFFFFSRIWFRQSQHIVVSHHHVHYQKNRRCTFLFMLNKSRKRDCIGHYTTYVERPIVLILLHNYVETYVYVYLYIYIIDQK